MPSDTFQPNPDTHAHDELSALEKAHQAKGDNAARSDKTDERAIARQVHVNHKQNG